MIKVPNISGLMSKLQDVLVSGVLTQGSCNKDFEDKVKVMACSNYAISCTNGSDALTLMYSIVPKGDVIVIQDNTHFATVMAALNAGYELFITDVGKGTMMMTVEDARKAIEKIEGMGRRVGAIVCTSIGGQLSSDWLKIRLLCDGYGCLMLEDSCHAHGSSFLAHDGEYFAGTIGHASAFSYFPTKVVFGAEGGVITTNSEGVASKLIKLRNLGRNRGWVDQYDFVGMNGRMSNVSACICSHVQDHLGSFIEARGKIAFAYSSVFDCLDNYKYVPHYAFCGGCRSNWYKYVVLCNSIKEKVILEEALKEANVPATTPVFEFPIHEQIALIGNNRILNLQSNFPNATTICKEHVSLAINPDMTKESVDTVVRVLKSVVGKK